MSFFGFEQQIDLEEEKRKILERGIGGEREDLAVYTWGEESYDGLGDALQEGGDELNDETFGGATTVGKDFDFAAQALPADGFSVPAAHEYPEHRAQAKASYDHQQQLGAQGLQHRAASHPTQSLEAIWDNKSPFSVLPKTQEQALHAAPVQRHHDQHRPAASTNFSPFDLESDAQPLPTRQHQPATLSLGANQIHGVRTLEEIEAEMREAFAAQRLQNQSPSQAQILQQAQLRNVGQRLPPAHYVQGSTPPPRMHVQMQSPRFQQQQHHHQLLLQQQQQQVQLLELQEHRERQQRQQLVELQEQLRLEEMERVRQQQQQFRVQQNAQYLQHQRQASSGTPMSEVQYRRQAQRVGTPSRHPQQQQLDVPFQQNLQYLPREIQMQQKLLAEMAQAEFLRSVQGSPVNSVEDMESQEQLRAEAIRKIMEAERMEEKRKRKLEKIRYMSRYNDLMTQSDKDFITRIQVSQLVTQDPFSDDFYAQVFSRVMHTRLGVNAPEAVLKFGSGGGVGLGLGQNRGGRRQSAMQRMEQQVERIVNNARLREKEKITLNNLQGALGKTAGRSYKAAPRQLLQVDSGSQNGSSSPTLTPGHVSKTDASPSQSTHEGNGIAQKAAEIGHEALQGNGKLFEKKDPLTHRETLVILERIFDIIMELDRFREEPPSESEPEMAEREARFASTSARLYDALRVGIPLETSVPHPFISLITPVKGKKMFPRALRYVEQSKHLTIMTLILACFNQLDVVKDSSLLDVLNDSPERKEAEKQLDAFVHHVIHALLPVAATAGVRLIRGLLGVLMTRNDIGVIARTRPGIFILTLFISRIEQLSQEGWAFADDAPADEDLAEWQGLFNQLFTLLSPHLLYLFPSVRQAMANNIPLANVPDSDEIDQPVWQFLAIMAAHAAVEQQQILVSAVKERVLESVMSANKGYGVDNEEQRIKRLANVNIFLHALGLDSSQIAL